ncbi:MAG: CBS domain-containing protein [Nitrosarchaeum sp.]
MTHEYIFTHTAAPLFKVVRKMLENKISRIIVKDQNEKPIGIISFRNLFKISIELGSEEEDLAVAASKMIKNKVGGIPVVDSNQNLIGIVSKTDVVKAFSIVGPMKN